MTEIKALMGVPASIKFLFTRLEEIQEDRAFLGFLAPITDNHTRAIDDFSRIAFSIEDAC